MAQKREKPWVWDLDVEQKLTKKFCENFTRKDPLFAQWADCLYSICVMESKLRECSKADRPHNPSGGVKDAPPAKDIKKSFHEPEQTYDPVVFETGKLLAADPMREADRLKYLMIIFNESNSVDHESAGHLLNSVLGVALQ